MTDLSRPQDLAALRRAYARKVADIAGVSFPELERAYATVPREDFLGPPPWKILGQSGYVESGDIAAIYENVLVSLIPERRLNNGEPSGHAIWIDAARPRRGEHVVHIGAGTGYYTAILAELVGPGGRVTGIEFDAGLAARAAENTKPWPWISVRHDDGCTYPFEAADVIYVSAGATHPVAHWLDGLRQGGRLVAPLTAVPTGGFPMGAVFSIEKRGEEYLARCVSPAGFIPCEGCREGESEKALAEAFAKGGQERVTRLVRHGDLPEEQCWLRTPEWSLVY
jgi:protein-L-isoaspartate(D-aspartate) O-methyltransferase